MKKLCDCERCQRGEVTLDDIMERAGSVFVLLADVVADLGLIGDHEGLHMFQCRIDDLFRQSVNLLGSRIEH